MLTNTKFVFSLFLFSLCFFSACQKEAIVETATPVPSIYAHLEGNFYTERIQRTSYGYASVYFYHSDTADVNIQILAKNDTLSIFNYEFPIQSTTQTSFSKSFGTFYNPEELKLDYYNNYDSIVLSHEVFSRAAGANPTSKVVYSGVRNRTNYISSFSSVYTLKVIQKEFAAQIDTQYTADLSVDVMFNPYYSGYYSVEYTIGMHALRYNSFYTYSNEHKTGNNGTSKKIVYMKNDSLYIDYYEASEGSIPPYLIDTVYYSFQGIKK